MNMSENNMPEKAPGEKVKFTQSKAFRFLMWALGVAAAILVVFQAGYLAGLHRAFFNCKWGENYARNFGGPAQPMSPFQGGGLSPRASGPADMSGHGVTGEIIAVDADGIVVRGQDNAERFVIPATGTAIIRQSKKVDLDELKVGDVINVIGRPDDLGRIEAHLIRVMPGGFPKTR
jgi:hypothetical protein